MEDLPPYEYGLARGFVTQPTLEFMTLPSSCHSQNENNGHYKKLIPYRADRSLTSDILSTVKMLEHFELIYVGSRTPSTPDRTRPNVQQTKIEQILEPRGTL